jgi:hypothetical protein
MRQHHALGIEGRLPRLYRTIQTAVLLGDGGQSSDNGRCK